VPTLTHGLARLRRFAKRCASAVRAQVGARTRPLPLAAGLATDVARSRRELVLEHALLCHQVLVLRRTGKRPARTPLDRGLLVVPASRLRTWAGALPIVRPETVLRWHRQGCRRRA